MKAIRIHQYGDASVLRVDDAPVPDIAAGEVLVRVVAAAVNPVDWKIREGHLSKMMPYTLPLTLGWDVSGVVEAMGEGVTKFGLGDAVYGRPDLARNGTYAEYAAIREDELASKPLTISHVDAASLPLAGITAHEALFRVGALRAGQTVLVHAASGGVGSLAVQLARHHGAQVIATTSARNRALVESLGAHQVIDYRRQSFVHAVKNVDLVFDTLGAKVQEDSWSVLAPGGMLVSIVEPPAREKANALGVRGEFLFIGPNAPVLIELARMIDGGTLRPVIGAEFSLDQIVQAHQLSQSGRAVVKIVLYVGRP
jgi:NADPH:quinone reductase-like Zn-dependent oxidoreductase